MTSDSGEEIDSDEQLSEQSDAEEEQDEGNPLIWAHKIFLQAIMNRRVVTQVVAEALHKDICHMISTEYSRGDLAKLIDDINATIEKYGFAIKRSSDPFEGKACLVYVNTRSDSLTESATEYSPREVDYFKQLIAAIMESGDSLHYSITLFDALNVASNCKPKIKKETAQLILDSFVKKNWLVRSNKIYSLSLRTLLELENYLKNEFPEETEVSCVICEELVTVGYKCTTDNCDCRGHLHCLKDYYKSSDACPACKQAWPRDMDQLIAIGPKAHSNRRKSNVNRRAAHFAVAEQDSSEDDENAQSDEEAPTQSAAKKKAPSRKNGASQRTSQPWPSQTQNANGNASLEEEELPSQRGSLVPQSQSAARKAPSRNAKFNGTTQARNKQRVSSMKEEPDADSDEDLTQVARQLREMDSDDDMDET